MKHFLKEVKHEMCFGFGLRSQIVSIVGAELCT